MQVKLACIGISIFSLSFPLFMIAQQSLECGDPAPLWILDKSPKAGQIYKSGEKTNTPEAYKSSAGVPQSNPPLADKSQAKAPDKKIQIPGKPAEFKLFMVKKVFSLWLISGRQ